MSIIIFQFFYLALQNMLLNTQFQTHYRQCALGLNLTLTGGSPLYGTEMYLESHLHMH